MTIHEQMEHQKLFWSLPSVQLVTNLFVGQIEKATRKYAMSNYKLNSTIGSMVDAIQTLNDVASPNQAVDNFARLQALATGQVQPTQVDQTVTIQALQQEIANLKSQIAPPK